MTWQLLCHYLNELISGALKWMNECWSSGNKSQIFRTHHTSKRTFEWFFKFKNCIGWRKIMKMLKFRLSQVLFLLGYKNISWIFVKKFFQKIKFVPFMYPCCKFNKFYNDSCKNHLRSQKTVTRLQFLTSWSIKQLFLNNNLSGIPSLSSNLIRYANWTWSAHLKLSC